MADKTFTFNIKAVADMKDVISNVNNIQQALQKLTLPPKLKNEFSNIFKGLETEVANYQKIMSEGFKTKGDVSALEKSGKKIISLYQDLGKTISNISNSDIKTMAQSLAKDGINEIKNSISQLKQELASIASTQIKADGFDNVKNGIKDILNSSKDLTQLKNTTFKTLFNNIETGKLENATNNLESIKKKLQELDSQKGTNYFDQLKESLAQVEAEINKISSTEDFSNVSSAIDTLDSELKNITAQPIKQVSSAVKELDENVEKTIPVIKELHEEDKKVAEAQAQFNSEIDQVKSRIQYFLGLNNAINLVKRAIRGAVDTIQELDKAMTATAVVTDFSVSDMWEQLPEYTKRANELGVTTQAAYEAATLYYQQGLSTNEVTALSVETLKMARIAGLDAADATDRMTNALRGFNMELTEANAQRVNDVYSQLAAKSASNVDEISTAMTKVASLAHNANMEFETTAAFLAQIIETTRESAETAGTALKTVVARFSEVKKLVDEGELKGTDEEGQAIDVNKVSQALRTAGIDMNKYFLGEVGLDDIFMELASKWDSLTAVQQRYIATQAAGSRQQSRFIAMMQDYNRTLELTELAYNANGASAEQFAKTQESLESKIARLKNAWNEFLMGLTNNVVVKTFVDLLTDLLNTINKITGAFGDGAGAVLRWATALGALISLKKISNSNGFASLLSGTANSPLGQLLGLNGKILNKDGTEASPKTFGSLFFGKEGQKGLFDAIGSSKLGQKVGEGLQKTKIGQAIGEKIFGSMAPTAAAELTTALTGVATALGVVAVAVGVVVAAYQAWLHLTPEGQLKIATQLADTMKDVAANTQEAANSLKNANEQYAEKTAAVNDASNIKEQTVAIKDRNEYIQSLLDQNAAYAEYVSTSIENGEIVLTLDEDALAEAARIAAEGATKAAAASDLAKATQAEKQADVYEARLKRNGVNLENNTIIRYDNDGNSYRDQMTNEERAKYQGYQVQADSQRQQSQAFATQAFAKMIPQEIKDLGDDTAQLVAESLGKNFNANDYYEQIQKQRNSNWWNGNATKKELQAEYLRLYGSEADTSMGRKELAQAVAQAQVQQGQQDITTAVSDLVASNDKAKQVLQAYNGKGTMVENSLAGLDFTNMSDTELQKTLGLDNTAIQELATAMGMESTELLKQIREQAKLTQSIQKTNKAKVFQKMQEAGLTFTKDLQDKVNNLTPEETEKALAAAESAQSLLSPEDFSTFMQNLPDLIGTEQFKEIQTLFDSINLDNPIMAFTTLNDAMENGTDTAKKYAKQILDANDAVFDTGNMFQMFVTSASYDELTESLDKFIETNGEINSSNIKELAKSNKELNAFLESGRISAEGLARALTALEKGEAPIEGLTTRVLEAISTTESFKDLINDVHEFIANFDEGLDYGEGSDFFSQKSKTLLEYIDNLELGNERTQKLFDAFMGEGAYADLVQKYTKDGITDITGLAAEAENRVKTLTALIENNSYGFMNTFSGNETLGITTDGNGGFNWDLRGRTTDQLVQDVQSQLSAQYGYDVGEDYAKAVIEGWAAQSPNFRMELDDNNFKAAMESFVNDTKGAKVITEQELQALAASYGKTVDDIKQYCADNNIQLPVIVDWRDSEGNLLTGEGLIEKFNTTIGKSGHYNGSEFVQDYTNFLQGCIDTATGNIDAGKLMDKIMEYEPNPAQAQEIANNIVSSTENALLQKTIKVPVNVDGVITQKEVTITADSMEGLAAAENAAMEAANYDLVGESIANQNLDGFKTNINDIIAEAADNLNDQLSTAASNVDTSQLQNNISTAGQNAANNTQTALTNAGSNAISSIQTQLATTPFSGTLMLTTVASGTSGALGGIVKAYAKGSGTNFIQPGWALTGEEGPEIVWNKNEGYSYITGGDGPEFQTLKPGDRVFNAQETARILKNTSFAKGGIMGSYSNGGYNPKLVGGGSGGGGGGDGKGTNWRNELDWLYNLMEDIAELERQQTILDDKHEDLLEDISATGRDLYKITKEQLNNLYTQLDNERMALAKRQQEMDELIGSSGYSNYVWWNSLDQSLEIDWNAIEALQDKDTYDEITDLISRAEKVQDQMDDASEAIRDIEDEIREIEKRYLDEFTDFQKRILDAVKASYQNTIDSYSTLNDTLNDTNSSILDAIQKEIDLERQIRDNTKTEQDITDMEARLAYLQRDTSGANAQEIRQLEKQLQDARESYQDTLVDQKLEKLSQDNDKASEQREHQIDIMQSWLDYQVEIGGLWEEVAQLMEDGFNNDGRIIENSDLWNILKDTENWQSLSQVQKAVWADDLILEANQAGAYLLKISEGLDSISAGVWATIPAHSIAANKIQYATGGLNTMTGPAWLDGTPSEPEYVLNARQTDAFLRLADILPSMFGGNETVTNYSGGVNLNLVMNVDEIGSDYDVDRIADRVKDIIYNASTYRNVNTLSFTR